jgi:uncharacterized protein YbbC (DUF1343 family)
VAFLPALFLAPSPAAADETTVSIFPQSGRVLGPGPVRSGLDILREEGFRRLQGKRAGVLTHRAAVDRNGDHLLDLLRRNPSIQVVSVFAPEHGLYGDLDTHVADFREPKSGLLVHSLYTTDTVGRKARFYPRRSDLQGLDAVVVDMQDIGARFYTYTTLLGFMMEACHEAGVEVIVLDRPNPIGGLQVAGPLPDPDLIGTLAAFYPLPTVHIGELALLYQGQRMPEARVSVVRMEGWTRNLTFDQTGLRWLDPSPNIQTLDAALAYPGSAMVETQVSMGRGTDKPFAQLGAPWIDDPQALADALTTTALPGLRVSVTDFTPTGTLSRAHPGERKLCLGVRYEITDRANFRPVTMGIILLSHLQERYGSTLIPERRRNPQNRRMEFTGRSVPQFDPLASRGLHAAWIAAALRERKTIAQILETIERQNQEFRTIRQRHLLYP